MTDEEAVKEIEEFDRVHGPLSDEDRKHFENILILKAYVRGWTGDPLEQPPTAVLGALRQMMSEKEAVREPCKRLRELSSVRQSQPYPLLERVRRLR